MSASILLAGLRRRGFAVTYIPGRDAVVVLPASKLTEADRRAITANLAGLKAMLEPEWNPAPQWEPRWFSWEWFQRPEAERCRSYRATVEYEEEMTDACED